MIIFRIDDLFVISLLITISNISVGCTLRKVSFRRSQRAENKFGPCNPAYLERDPSELE